MPDMDRLNRALSIEAQHAFSNLRGRQTLFADFISTELTEWLSALPPAKRSPLLPVAAAFARYAGLSPADRERAVGDLQALILAFTPRAKEAGPIAGKEEDWRDRPVQFVKGIGPRIAALLAKVDVHTVDDLLHCYPRDYLDFNKRVRIGALVADQPVTIWGTVKRTEAYNPPGKAGMSILTVWLADGSGTVAARWFGKRGSKFQLERMRARFVAGQTLLVSGEPKMDSYSGRLVFDRPETHLLGDTEGAEADSLHAGRIVPIYRLTEGLGLKVMRKALRAALDLYLPLVRDSLPVGIREQLADGDGHPLWPLKKALEQIHFPTSDADREAARRRLAFNELFWMQLGLAYRRAQQQARAQALVLPAAGELVARFQSLLPFSLTGAQQRVFLEIQADLAAPTPMNRLIQGDVGSGKTVVALLALLMAIENGYQGALMAPTEILAEQHHDKIRGWVERLGLRVALLTGRQTKRERTATQRAIEAHQIHLVVGTHALISDPLSFARLGLVVIDEQHRFGVRQRASLRAKGEQPEVLVMTATPIPRTLALTIHGDLDVSVIDELPPGRKPVQTQWARSVREQREVWEAVRAQLQAGRQCYVVYPLISDSDKLEAVKSAVAECERLATEVFPDMAVGLLHGHMASDEKDTVMNRFRRGEIDLLVSTTVIEVGVDVPNASVMVVDNAERFGLAQLHQLRGRVGRGAAQSYCYLFSNSRSEITRQRLEIMVATNDGFVIAEQDLAMRGPGEFLGTRQSGLPEMRAADLVKDTVLLERAREMALRLIAADPAIAARPLLKADLFRYFQTDASFLDA